MFRFEVGILFIMYRFINYLMAFFWPFLISGFTSGSPLPEKQGQIFIIISISIPARLPHNDMLIYLNREYIRGLETNVWFGNPYPGTNNPDLGAGYVFSNLGNRDVFGHIHAAYLSILNPLGQEAFSPDLKINLGIGMGNKKV
jgi:hypothetical protein